MLNCKQVSQLVSQSLDKKLTFKERIGVHMHLMICKYCKRFQKQLLVMRVGIKRITEQVEQDETIQMPSELKARITNKFNASK